MMRDTIVFEPASRQSLNSTRITLQIRTSFVARVNGPLLKTCHLSVCVLPMDVWNEKETIAWERDLNTIKSRYCCFV
jgi:hypothetical protein